MLNPKMMPGSNDFSNVGFPQLLGGD